MYHDFANREVEDLEMDNMRHDAAEAARRSKKHLYSIRFEWKLADMWIGVYWRRERYTLHIWICFLPCIPLHVVLI